MAGARKRRKRVHFVQFELEKEEREKEKEVKEKLRRIKGNQRKLR